jgi:uncharacterized protein YjbI with pentapeptide repeats
MKREDLIQPPLTFTSQVYQHGGRDNCALTVYLGFSLLEKGRVLTEQDAWKAASQSLAPYADLGVALDAGIGKPKGEFLAAGSAFVPEGKEAQGVSVSLSVGQLSRDFMALGEQEAGGPTPGPPLPFKSLPLGWAQTLADKAENPHGIVPGETPGQRGCPLAAPRVVAAGRNQAGEIRPEPALTPSPASPLPRPFGPARLKNLGTFDQNWLFSAWPGFPEDFNWAFFNAAQEGQRLANGYFRGDEPVTVTHMHRDHPVFKSALPGLRPRLLLKRAETWLELAPVLDTVWLFPNFAAGMLIWHAGCQAIDELASDLAEVVCGLEPLAAQPLPAAALVTLAHTGWAPPVTAEISEPEKAEEAPEPPAAPAAEPPPPSSAPPAPPAVPAVPPLAAAMMTPAMIMAESRKILAAELPEINQTLKGMNLPEITMEQMEPHLAKQSELITKAMDIVEKQEAEEVAEASMSEDELLIKALTGHGLSPEAAEGIRRAIALPIPQETQFQAIEDYDRAMNDYGALWAKLMGAKPEVGLNHAKDMKIAGLAAKGDPEAAMTALMGKHLPPEQAKKAALSLLHPPEGPEAEKAAFVEAMSQQGLAPEMAGPLFTLLNNFEAAQAVLPLASFKEKQLGLLKLGQGLEKILGLPAGQMAEGYRKNFTLIRQTAYGQDEMGEQLEALALEKPELAPYLPELHRLRKDPGLESDSLCEIALAAGINSPALLVAIAPLDVLNPTPPKPPADLPPKEPIKEEQPEPTPEPDEFKTGPLVFTNREEVIAALEKGRGLIWRQAVLAGLDLSGLDFSALDLREANFSESDLVGSVLAKADFRGVIFSGVKMAGADLGGSDFSGADLSGALATGISFKGAKLPGADFSRADLSESNFEGAAASKADFSRALLPKRWAGADLKEAKFAGSDLSGADFSGAALDKADFTETNLEAAVFKGAAGRGLSFLGCNLRRADFSGAGIPGLRIYPGCDLTGASFREAQLDGAGFQGSGAASADFTAARASLMNMSGLCLKGGVFQGAVLRETVFFASDLTGADFSGADLMKASLGSAVLHGAVFDRASLYGSNLFRARTDPKTSFLGADINNTCLMLKGDPIVRTGGLL